ncbi:hypothetical protein RF55_8423 [Lasius niger]|uniref:Uncharacterized protein n=1 Tax=Lasius niger TaxID=67767 RepID=A0A0J7NGK7_LASNI|nr:hypothetical protein RF55_8423 [Lasius niger]
MNRKIERLLNDQADLYGRISRAIDNLKKTGAAKITEVLAGHNYVTQDLPELAEESYLDQKGTFLDLLRNFQEKRSPAVPAANLDSSASTSLPHPRCRGFSNRYSLCQRDHFLMLCEEYKRKTAAERKQHIKANSLCLNCLGRHKVSECASKKDCTACGARHHTPIHDACRETEVTKTSHVAQRPAERPTAVLFATARLRVADRHRAWHSVRALVDQRSESTIISECLAQKLRLLRSPASVSVFGVGGQKTAVVRGRVGLPLSPRSVFAREERGNL